MIAANVTIFLKNYESSNRNYVIPQYVVADSYFFLKEIEGNVFFCVIRA